MNDFIAPVAVWCAAIIEAIGIGTITLFALYALFNAAARMLKKEENDSIFQELRQSLGHGILLGLEFLIASDIIYTVAVELTFQKIGVLAIVVLIRTCLVSYDHIPKKSYPLFRAREVLEQLAAAVAERSPEGDCRPLLRRRTEGQRGLSS